MTLYWIWSKDGSEFLFETEDAEQAREHQEMGYEVTAVSAS
jgi:hypothetical protein